ncbi:protein EVI2B [Otolemur garnettii]|uniref:Ecotropic viral integration site 2B n=1 Tax=Otolemur garnettii TaxID=30611 RepID=H0X1V6_OTOGA|nr:protein EVI2B [Otolemur garnettii]
MDPSYFILMLFCGHLENTFSSKTEEGTTKLQPQPTSFRSSMSYTLADSQNPTGTPLGQPTQFNNISSGQLTSSGKVAPGQSMPAVHATSGKPSTHTSAGRPLASITTKPPIPMINTSSQQTALPVLTSARQTPPSTPTSTRKPPISVYTSTQQLSLSVHTPRKREPTSTVKNSLNKTPGFIFETTTSKTIPHSNSVAAILIGVILISMLAAIIMIALWKCLRKPVLSDQNWAGRSPFADGETPDICMDNIRENEVSTKRTSIVSLMTWKPSKSTLLADDLEIQLFESSENIEDSNNSKTQEVKDQGHGTSEDSADRSTIGTAVSSAEDADLPPPPPLLDLEGQESNQSEKPTMIIEFSLPNDSTSLPPSLDCLDQGCEDHKTEIKQSFPPPLDSLNLPPPPADLMKNQEEFNTEIQSEEFSIPPASDQDLNESLPPPPAELL